MIRLRALGTVDLRGDDGGEIRSLLMQPKRLALFAYLALARPRGFQRRDSLLAVFWPDVAPERARAALNQAVFVLRRSLGAAAIVGRGADELAVSAERVSCDVWELESALTAGESARVTELYRGELLQGLGLPDAGEFDRWLDGERKHWASRHLQALRELSDGAESSGDIAGAVTWARRILDHVPYDEPACVRLMQLLARLGDRAAAIRECERFSDRLWNDVELRLSPATREVLSRIKREAGLPAESAPGIGRAAGTGTASNARPAGDAESRGVTGHSGGIAATPRQRHLRVAGIAAIALLAVVGAGAGVARLLRPPKPAPLPASALAPTRVAVMYFDEQDPSQHLRPLADGLTEQLINELSHVDGLAVISPNAVRLFRGRSLSLDSIRKVLGKPIPLLISGSVSRSGEQVRVVVRLEDASNGTTLRSNVVNSRWGEPFALIDRLLESVSGFLRAALGREIRLTRAHAGTASVVAWELFRRAETLRLEAADEESRGRTDVARANLLEADSLLVAASGEDPRWIDPLLSRARLANGAAFMVFATGGPNASRAILLTGLGAIGAALERSPDNAGALELRGILRYDLSVLAPLPGKAADSLVLASEKDLRTAVALEPERADAWATLSAMDLTAGKLAAAKQEAERAYGADAYAISAHDALQRLFRASFELHQDADARSACAEIERRFGQGWDQAYCALLLMAWADRHVDPERAWAIYDAPSRIDSPATRALTRPLLGMIVAAGLARAGLSDSARHVIARAHAEAAGNPEVQRLEAAARLVLGDTAEGHRLLAAYTQDRSAGRMASLHSRIFERPLQNQAGQ